MSLCRETASAQIDKPSSFSHRNMSTLAGKIPKSEVTALIWRSRDDGGNVREYLMASVYFSLDRLLVDLLNALLSGVASRIPAFPRLVGAKTLPGSSSFYLA